MQFHFLLNQKSIFSTIALFVWSITCHAQNNTPALEFIKKNDIAKAKSFFDKQNVNTLDKDGDNLLMNAALYGSLDMMDLLLKKGANPNLQNTDGETALMWALYDIEKVKLLLSYGADINIKSKQGNSALLIACVGANQYELVKLLMDQGANVLERNGKQETALGRAAIFG
ncbi:MAG: ankyrin repeat domain-containing protein, partial [Flavisolibacter sp.]